MTKPVPVATLSGNPLPDEQFNALHTPNLDASSVTSATAASVPTPSATGPPVDLVITFHCLLI